MSSAVTPITLHYPFRVNCYAVETDGGYVLIDTGRSPRRAELEKRFQAAGCRPGSLRLIVLTHAHTDHAGNCAYLLEKYGAPIAMHADDVGKVERGDMFWSPKGKRAFASVIARTALSVVGLGKFDAFEPDLFLNDVQDLREYGCQRRQAE